jgi:acyl transferase domain-containing protein
MPHFVTLTPSFRQRTIAIRPTHVSLASGARVLGANVKRAGIAIVGMAGWFIDADDVDTFWANLKAGRECVGANVRVIKSAGAIGSHIVEPTKLPERPSTFDASLFGLSPREAERLEPQQRQFLELAWEAMEDGGYAVETAGANVGVFGGANFTSYYGLAAQVRFPECLDDMIGADKDYLATRVAHHLGLKGPALTVQCACSTSLVAVHLACQSLLSGECDAALAGGVGVTRPRLSRYTYMPGGILSPDGFCRAFDADAKGTVFTEGAGVVLLMRLEDALLRRHPIYAVMRGSAVNNDGGGKPSYMAPSIAGQERVIRAAMAAAGVSPADIGFIEAHGSATVLGDAIELAALSRVFRGEVDGVGVCRLGSVKTNIGHTASAAGVAGLMKAALALKHELIPANVNFCTPNPDLDLTRSPFRVNADAEPWPRRKGRKRYAGVSSFGVGGTNAHAILEEAPQLPAAHARREPYVLTLSARSEEALGASAVALHKRLARASRRELADVAYTLNVGRRPLEHRATMVCSDVREARRMLSQSATLGGHLAPGVNRLAFLFPGQGSQYAGMGRQLYQEGAFGAAIDECLAVLKSENGPDLSPLFLGTSAPSDFELAQTRIAQPLIFTFEYALARLLISWGTKPQYAIGHSVGEFAAACLAGVFSLPAALKLVALRGALMQTLPAGAMLAVIAPPDAFVVPPELDVAAVNSPRQTVLSGPRDAITEFSKALGRAGIPSGVLRTSHAFHSRMMDPILAEFREAVLSVEIGAPVFPIVSSVTAGLLAQETLRDPDYWVRHIREPVLFEQGLDTLVRRGVDAVLEVGPGRQLSGLAQQNGLHRQHVRIINTMNHEGSEHAERSALVEAISRLWLEGGGVDWTAFHAGEKRRMVRLPAYTFDRRQFRSEPAKGRATELAEKLEPSRWLYLPSWRRVTPTRRADGPGSDGCWLVLEDQDRSDARGQIAARLSSSGERVISVRWGDEFKEIDERTFALDANSPKDVANLFEILKSRNLVPRRIVHAFGLGGEDDGLESADEPPEIFARRQQSGILSLAHCLKAYREVFRREPSHFEIVASGLLDVTGTEPLRPAGTSALAFARVAPQENVQLTTRVLDVDPRLLVPGNTGKRAYTQIVEAIMSPLEERVMALRENYWWAQGVEPCPVAEGAVPRLKRGGVYLITGGMGYIGMIFARHLASQWGAQLILAGRSPLEDAAPADAAQPSRKDRLTELATLGGEALYIQADVSKLEDVQRLRAAIHQRFGRLDGIIFGAGTVEARGAIHELDETQLLEENFAAKVHGLKHVLDAFGADPLDFGIVLSSISTLLGGMGLCAYSAANQIADILVFRHRRKGHLNWTTTNWDLWGDGHLGEAGHRFGFLLALAIQPEEGAKALEEILSLPQLPQVIVSTHDLAARIAYWVSGGVLSAAAIPDVQHKRPSLATTYVEVEGEFEHKLHAVLSRILGIETIGRDDDFFEMGGHSILALRASVDIQDILPPDAPAPNLYDTPTIRTLAQAFGQHVAAA